jgi:FixJ family two-component response regulator
MTPFSAPVAVREPTILIVDDDQAVRSSLSFSLQVDGFPVRAYAAASELLEATDLPENGCLVVDYYLPDTTGLELLRALRARRVNLPAVLVTSNPSQAVRRQAAAAGVPIIEKPLLGNALIDGIRDALARASKRL